MFLERDVIREFETSKAKGSASIIEFIEDVVYSDKYTDSNKIGMASNLTRNFSKKVDREQWFDDIIKFSSVKKQDNYIIDKELDFTGNGMTILGYEAMRKMENTSLSDRQISDFMILHNHITSKEFPSWENMLMKQGITSLLVSDISHKMDIKKPKIMPELRGGKISLVHENYFDEKPDLKIDPWLFTNIKTLMPNTGSSDLVKKLIHEDFNFDKDMISSLKKVNSIWKHEDFKKYEDDDIDANSTLVLNRIQYVERMKNKKRVN